MEGTIAIKLRTDKTIETGSGLPDLGHDAYWLTKTVPDLTFKDSNGKERPLGDKYEIVGAPLDVSVGLWSAGVDAAVTDSQLLEGAHEMHASELVAVVAEHPLQLPVGGL